MPQDKGLNRGGSLGQEGEIGKPREDRKAERDLQRGIQGDKPDKRDNQKQPGIEDKQKIQPTHEVD